MKGRVLLAITAAALVAVMCVGFSGCGGVNAESVRGEKVTEEQWNSALEYFTEDNAVYSVSFIEQETVEAYAKIFGEELSGKATGIVTVKAIKNGATEYLKRDEKCQVDNDCKKILEAMSMEYEEYDRTNETYSSYRDGKYTIYRQDNDGKWGTYIASSSIMPNLTSLVQGTYNEYEYSEDLRGYAPKNRDQYAPYYILKFNSEGRLSAIYSNSKSTKLLDRYEYKASRILNLVIEYQAKNFDLPTVE